MGEGREIGIVALASPSDEDDGAYQKEAERRYRLGDEKEPQPGEDLEEVVGTGDELEQKTCGNDFGF